MVAVRLEQSTVLSEMQNWFRRDQRAEDHVMSLIFVIEGAKIDGKVVFTAFLDLKKAYDTVDWETLWDILGRWGFGGQVLEIIRDLYKGGSTVAK